ncbi:MAG: CBS domain-containing protein [Alphaproteobacteria bacterium]
MTVANILKQKGGGIISVHQDQTVLEALNILAEHHIGAVFVMADGDKIIGVLSERDIVRALPTAKGKLRAQKISSIMTTNVISCDQGDSIETVMAIMTKNKIRHLPVVNGGNLVGVISIGDVVKERIAETEHEAEAMKKYIVGG